MAARQLDVHPAALEEFKSAGSWYLERNQTAADRFVIDVDRAIDQVIQSPSRWPKARMRLGSLS